MHSSATKRVKYKPETSEKHLSSVISHEVMFNKKLTSSELPYHVHMGRMDFQQREVY
jgi:hypothetical protein